MASCLSGNADGVRKALANAPGTPQQRLRTAVVRTPGSQTLTKWDGHRRALDALARAMLCHRSWRQGAELGCMVLGWRMKAQQQKALQGIRARQARSHRGALANHWGAALLRVEKLAAAVAKVKAPAVVRNLELSEEVR